MAFVSIDYGFSWTFDHVIPHEQAGECIATGPSMPMFLPADHLSFPDCTRQRRFGVSIRPCGHWWRSCTPGPWRAAHGSSFFGPAWPIIMADAHPELDIAC